jgi:hemerythrin-like metal-binding protein
MFVWNQSYATGNADIDAQHKQLFVIMDELQEAMKTGQSKAILGRTLGKLVDYTVKHFAFEQSLLRQEGYPETDAHRLIHEHFTARIKKLKADHDSGALGVGVELMGTLQTWLADHIKRTDMKYAKELGFRN